MIDGTGNPGYDPGMEWRKAIRRELDLRGWTQRDLAKRAEVDHTAVCRWLGEKREPSRENLEAMLAAVDISLSLTYL